MSVNDIIRQKLQEIEKQEDVSVLLAVESGSRAWGFESLDSDYDVRFLYVYKKDWYLKLQPARDVINSELNEVYDVNGWDVQKMFHLLYNSNPTIFEWIHSPVVYYSFPVIENITPDIDKYFSCKAGIYHYISMAKSNYKQFLSENTLVKLKKYFYVIRPLLACEWIVCNHTPPPVLFNSLVNSVDIEKNIYDEIQQLIIRKKSADETQLIEKIPLLDEFIKQCFKNASSNAEKMQADKNKDWNKLNEMFFDCLNSFDKLNLIE